MKLITIGEGFVSRREPGSPTSVAVGPRCAVTDEGDLLCTFMTQSKLGVNDFVPMQSVSRDNGVTWEEAQADLAAVWKATSRSSAQ